jgi:hypothetical protein
MSVDVSERKYQDVCTLCRDLDRCEIEFCRQEALFSRVIPDDDKENAEPGNVRAVDGNCHPGLGYLTIVSRTARNGVG